MVSALGERVCWNEKVYRPSHDTLLIVEYLERNPQLVRGKAVLDVGSGTGIVGIVAARLGARTTVSIDIAPTAVRATLCTLRVNGVEDYHVARCDLHTCIREKAPFDLIVFNPPYLPLPESECLDEESLAWCGGPNGTSVALRFLEGLEGWCKSGSRMLLVASSLMDFDRLLKGAGGIRLRVVGVRSFFFERIMLLEGEVSS